MVKERILFVVKAYPERSTKYGSSICTAGITSKGNWIRLYPINLDYYKRNRENLRKWSVISAEVRKASEKLSRKESHKVSETSIRLIHSDFCNTNKPNVWEKRKRIMNKMLVRSVEYLNQRKEQDHTSIGIIKPKKYSLHLRKPVNQIQITKHPPKQKNLFGGEVTIADTIEKAISVKFSKDG